MSQIDLFDDTKDSNLDASHPRLRSWNYRFKGGETAKLELYRPLLFVGMVPARMLVHFRRDEKEIEVEEADWDQVLNEGLIASKVRAIDMGNESERFALGLRDGLRTVEKEFGNGFFSGVLIDVIQESEVATDNEVAEVLKHTYHVSSERGRSYDRCRESIALAINARARELKRQLGYSQEEAKTILTSAIAKYLDERFSVSSRKRLGLV